MRRTDDAANFIIDTLKNIFHDDYTDVTKVQLYCHYIESILISLLNAQRIGISCDDDLETLHRMTEIGLLSADIPAFFGEYTKHMACPPQFFAASDWSNVHTIHEGLLGRELNIAKNTIRFTHDKVTRDNTGSYYTPGNLALAVVREAINQYLKVNDIDNETDAARLLSQTKFADLSCGSGEFIKAFRTELIERYHIAPEQVSMNLYGVDIDPIALQITVCDLLEIMPKDSWSEIVKHFVLGNPLINQPMEKDSALKTRLFATGRYYAADMGINICRLFADADIDIVAGNPPWEKIRFEERKFFKPIIPEISMISQKNKRQAAIEKLQSQQPYCYDWYRLITNDYIHFKKEAKKHPYLNKSLNGELNTYVLFTELSLNIVSKKGVLALLVKSAIATSPANKPFFTQLTKEKKLASLCLFTNSLKIFDIDSREQFCVITCTNKENPSFELIAGATKAEDLHDLERSSITSEDMSIINPYTQMLPNISKNTDIQILLATHRRLPLFDRVYPRCHFGRLVHLTSHAQYIDTNPTDSNVPIYEGKFIERYDARFATFAGMPDDLKYSAKAQARKNIEKNGLKPMPECRYFIRKDFWKKLSANYTEPYMLCWRSLTSLTNTRTTLAMILPTMPTCQSIQFLQTDNPLDLLMMLALLNSKPFDYLVRLKMPGIDLTQSVIRQIPVPDRDAYRHSVRYADYDLPLEKHILYRVASILSDEPMVSDILEILDTPPAAIQKKPRNVLENELDDLFFIAYGFSETEIREIQNAFKK
jgi:hypothetical protein